MNYKNLCALILSVSIITCTIGYCILCDKNKEINILTKQRNNWYNMYLQSTEDFIPKKYGVEKIKESMKRLTYKPRG